MKSLEKDRYKKLRMSDKYKIIQGDTKEVVLAKLQAQGLLLDFSEDEKEEKFDILKDIESSEERFDFIKKRINIDRVLSEENNKDIVDFYKNTKFLQYKWFYNSYGFMHMGISEDGKTHRKTDVTYQVGEIHDFIKENTRNIVELGCGQSSNLELLAYMHNDIEFAGIDLYPTYPDQRDYPNIKIIEGDYHALPFDNNSVDIIFSIESLCYSSNKSKVLEEVSRVLKSGGIYICFDAYALSTPVERRGIRREVFRFMEEGWKLTEFEHLNNWEEIINNSDMFLEERRDLTDGIKPCLVWLSGQVKKYTSFPFSLILSKLPKAVLSNTLAGYFILDAVRFGDLGYYMHRMKKN